MPYDTRGGSQSIYQQETSVVRMSHIGYETAQSLCRIGCPAPGIAVNDERPHCRITQYRA